MTIFIFSDGAEWLSEVPWLSMVEDENTSKEPAQVVQEVTKKPMTEWKIPMRRPAVALKTTKWHREHTRVYCLAKKEYETEVLAGKRKFYEEQRQAAVCTYDGVEPLAVQTTDPCKNKKNTFACTRSRHSVPWSTIV